MKIFILVLLGIWCGQLMAVELPEAIEQFSQFQQQNQLAPPTKYCKSKIKRMVKVRDGMIGLCRNKRDLYRYQDGGLYRLRPSRPSLIKNGVFEIDFTVNYLKCIEQHGHFSMRRERSPFDYSFDKMLPDLKRAKFVKKHIRVQKKNVQLQAYRDGIYKAMRGKVQKDGERYHAKLQIDLRKILKKDDYKKLKAGKKVVIPVDFSQVGQSRKIINYQHPSRYTRFHGGSFRVFFEISKEQGKIKLKVKS